MRRKLVGRAPSKYNTTMDLKEWEEKVLKPSLAKMRERDDEFHTVSGIPVPRFLVNYPVDSKKLGFPGSFPFTRGVQPTMYRARFWTMRQYAGFGTPEETNRRFKYLLEQGQTGLSVAFDLPTQTGYDSDHPIAISEIGRTGVAVDTVEDMKELFEGIPLDKVSVSFTINATALVILAMFIVTAEEQGVPPENLRGTVQNDILKEYTSRGTFIFPPKSSLRMTVDLIEFCSKNMPSFNTISISGYHMREAGATAVQEVAFTLSSAIEYVKNVTAKGISPDEFGSRVTFFFAAHNNILEEVAKFRSARRMWAQIMSERFGARKPEAQKLKFHVQTSGVTLTSQEPENNILRVGFQCLAAVLGGAQSIHTNSFDEALALPSEGAVKIALRTQQIIAYESGVADTVDPLGGSWLVEYLTDEIERKAWEYIRKIDKMGGMAKAVETGYVQREIAESAWEYQRGVEDGRTKIVGVNIFGKGADSKPKIFKLPEDVVNRKLEKLKRTKEARDENRVEECLKELEESARGSDNLMKPILKCVRERVTLGEICSTLEKVFGRFKPTTEF